MAQLLGNLPVGAVVKDTLTTYYGKPILFSVMEHNHAGEPEGSTALVTSRIITLKCFDAKESSGIRNALYSVSNIRQWLNSEAGAGEWYSAQHENDMPPSKENVSSGNGYDGEAGFLANFSGQLKSMLMAVTKRCKKNKVNGDDYEDVAAQKVFLLSDAEIRANCYSGVSETGTLYAMFAESGIIAYPTAEAVEMSEYKSESLAADKPWDWFIRDPDSGNTTTTVRNVLSSGSIMHTLAYYGSVGIRPACVVSSSILVSDTVDADGAYTMLWNMPPVISTESTALGDKNAPFELKYTVTDENNDAVTAVLKLDDETVQTIDEIVLGHEYSVKVSAAKINALAEGMHTFTISAEDAYGNSSTETVTFNRITSSIAISGENTNLGNKWQPFDVSYKVNDSGFRSIDVTEYMDDVETRAISDAPQNRSISFDLSMFDALADERSHRLTVKAVNSDGAEAYRHIDFTKLYKELRFETKPVETDAPAEKIMLNLDYDKAGNPEVKVEVTNCAYNAKVIWEDATEAFKNREAYRFSNGVFDADRYGVSVRVTVGKNSETERVYVYALGYCFD